MARDRANINTNIWADQDWRNLPMAEQHLYMLLTSHPTLSYAGVVDWREARIAAMTSGNTAQNVRSAAEGLQAQRFVFIDDSTEEILIRSFLRHDGLLKQPKLSISMVNAYGAIASSRIREVVTYEIQRLHQEFPTWAAFTQEKVLTLAKGKGTDMAEFTQGFTPSLTPPLRVSGAQAYPLPTTTATTTTTTLSSVRKMTSKETRLPDDWAPTAAHIERAKTKNIKVLEQAELFKLHAATHDRHAANWNAAFTTWLIKATPGIPAAASPWSKEFHK
jgi:hypothetical protein